MLIEMSHIYKSYNQGKLEVPILKDINFSMDEGEYVAIMGPSGSGKTTLMNLVGCLDQATSGSLKLGGKEVTTLTDDELADLRLDTIGFVFQTFELLPKATALDNVALPLTYAGVASNMRKIKARHALERVGLGDRLDFYPNQLSGGQKQRVAIARAIINNPKLLLADEPTGALDSTSGTQIMELFKELNEGGMGILMITHDSKVASRASRMVTILDGQLKGAEEV